MIDTRIGTARRTRAAAGRAATARVPGTARWRVRLWALLNAHALITGGAGSPAGGAMAEDDRRRLGARRQG